MEFFGGSLKMIRSSVMQHRACCMAMLGLIWSVACSAAPPTYTLTDLGILAGYVESDAVAVNATGQVAGNLVDSNGEAHAFIYSKGTMTVLGVVSGYLRAQAVSMNNTGEIVGNLFSASGGINAFSYTNGKMVELVLNGALSNQPSFANDVNDAGLVVGGGPSIQNYVVENAWIFPNSDLGVGSSTSEAYAINNSGQVVLGEDNGFGGMELFLYSNGTFQDLGTSVTGLGGDIRPCTINNSGQIIGALGNTGAPFLYSNGIVTDLSSAVGNESSIYDINNSGQIVGGSDAFVYTINGSKYFLRDLSISGGTGWQYRYASGINDAGQIVGSGVNPADNAVHAFLLTPTGGGGSNPPSTRLINISTRAQVGTGANILITGFVVGGSGTETLLVRADGPSLTTFGVTGVLAQPSMTVFDNAGTPVASNTGWATNANAAQIASAADSVGAFALTSGSTDCALLISLPAGAYTVQISGH
jgi:probable HAF family extracellular repeat protein